MSEEELRALISRLEADVIYLKAGKDDSKETVKQALMSFTNDLKTTTDYITARTDALVEVIHGDGSKGAGITVRLEKVEDKTAGLSTVVNRGLWAVFSTFLAVAAYAARGLLIA